MALDLGKQVGPMPLGAWIVVVAGGLGIALYSRNSSAEPEADPQRDSGGEPGVGEGPGGDFTPVTPGAPAPTVDPRSQVIDNQGWYVYVSNELIGRFNYNPSLVTSALTKYINGQGNSASVSERVIIGRALTIMIPPDPIPYEDAPTPPPPVTPVTPPPPSQAPGPVKPPAVKPKPKPAPPKPAARYYQVVKGDSLWKISVKYYRTGTGWPRIYAANRVGKRLPNGSTGKISNPNLIQPGWVLHIP